MFSLFCVMLMAFLPFSLTINSLTTIETSELSDIKARCREIKGSYFFQDPQSCPGYYLCLNGTVSHGECSIEYNFNEAKQLCDLPSNTRCADRECPRRVGYIPWRNSCSKYHLCIQGIVVRNLECPNGSHFDESMGQCNFPEVVQCGRDVCPQRKDAFDFVFQPHPEDCGRFYICNNNHKREFRCAEGFHWNSQDVQCLYVEDAGCEVSTPKFRCPPLDDKNSLNLTFHPHPLYRDQYFICAGQTPHLRSCGRDLIFNREEGRCTRP